VEREPLSVDRTNHHINIRVATPAMIDRRRFEAVARPPSSPMKWKHVARPTESQELFAAPPGPPGRYMSAGSVFRNIDTNGDGAIDIAELGSALRAMGRDGNSETVQALVRRVDADGNGVLDEAEFKHLIDAKMDLEVPAMEDRAEHAAKHLLLHNPTLTRRSSSRKGAVLQDKSGVLTAAESPTKVMDKAARAVETEFDLKLSRVC